MLTVKKNPSTDRPSETSGKFEFTGEIYYLKQNTRIYRPSRASILWAKSMIFKIFEVNLISEGLILISENNWSRYSKAQPPNHINKKADMRS